MALGERTTPPAGFVDFCARNPGQCGLKVQSPQTGPDPVQADIQKALYRRFLWSVAFRLADASAGDMKRSDADAPSTPTVLLRFAAAQVQPTAGSRLGPGARLEDAAWRPGVQADTPPLPALAPPVRISASTPDGPLIGETRSAPQQVALNARTAGDLNMVNRLVNSLITFSPDIKTYGVADYWAEPIEHQAGPIRGDCEDYVLEKRRALIARGFPAAALSIAVVRTRLGEDHAILLVATDRGELVLDSLSPWIVGWRDAPYTWVERQVPGAPMVWVKTGSRPKLLHTMIAATGDAPGLQPAAG